MGLISTYRPRSPLAHFGAAPMLAFLAIFLHVAAPLALQLAGPAKQSLFETVICSGGKAKTVYLDAKGIPVEDWGLVDGKCLAQRVAAGIPIGWSDVAF